MGTKAMQAQTQAGEVHIGSVGCHTKPVAVTPTITAGAYHAGDCIGGKIALADAARVTDGPETQRGTMLNTIDVIDAANQKKTLALLFWSANPADSTWTDNAAPVIHANDRAKFMGVKVIYPSDYISVGTTAVASVAWNKAMQPAAGSANLYLTIMTPDAPTYVAVSDLRLSFDFLPD